MSKKNTVIVINDRKYDAKTGALLSDTGTSTAHAALTPIAAPIHATAKSTPVPKPRAARKPASHTVAHRPTPSRTLMRRAVKKPAATKRRAKAQGPLDSSVVRHQKAIIVKSTTISLINRRLQHAKAIPKSQLIVHFSSVTTGVARKQPVVAETHPQSLPKPASPHSAGKKPVTTAELLEYALNQATSHEQSPVQRKRHPLFKRRRQSANA